MFGAVRVVVPARSYERSAASNAAKRRTRYVPSRFLSASRRYARVLVILLQEVRRRGDRGLQSIDGDPGGPVLALDVLDVLVPVKTTVRHGRRSSREPG